MSHALDIVGLQNMYDTIYTGIMAKISQNAHLTIAEACYMNDVEVKQNNQNYTFTYDPISFIYHRQNKAGFKLKLMIMMNKKSKMEVKEFQIQLYLRDPTSPIKKTNTLKFYFHSLDAETFESNAFDFRKKMEPKEGELNSFMNVYEIFNSIPLHAFLLKFFMAVYNALRENNIKIPAVNAVIKYLSAVQHNALNTFKVQYNPTPKINPYLSEVQAFILGVRTEALAIFNSEGSMRNAQLAAILRDPFFGTDNQETETNGYEAHVQRMRETLSENTIPPPFYSSSRCLQVFKSE